MKRPNGMFPFVAGSYQSRSPNFDAQRTVNLYAEASESGNSKSVAMLIGCPGTLSWSTSFSTVIRGMLRVSAEVSLLVSSESIVRLDSDKTVTNLLIIPASSSRASIATNGQIAMIVTGAGGGGYFVNLTTFVVTQITDPDFTGGDVVYFLDGYFVWNKPGTQQFQITELYGSDIDSLDFASAEGSPDLLVSLIVDHRELWLMGESTTEVFINSGNPDFPFERIQGAFIEQGCAAKYSVAKMTDQTGSGTVIWLSQNDGGKGMVVRSVGYQPRRISDHALEYQIAQYSRIDDAFAYTYQQEGHNFYMLTFPTANKTWCYDTSTEMWHERAWRNPLDGSLNRHRSNCHMQFAGKNLVGDFENGAICELSLDVHMDDVLGSSGNALVAIRQCPHLSAKDGWQFFHELWIDMQTGVGLSNDLGVSTVLMGRNPQLLLEWSDDGGHTFPYSRTISMGKIGEYKLRAVARRLGKSRDRVFRVSISDPVKRIFIDAGCRVDVAA